MKFLKAILAIAFLSSPGLVQAKTLYTLLETCRSQYLNKPGIGIYKNALCITELNVQQGEIDGGLVLFKGLGKADIDEHSLGNEIDFYMGWRHRFEWVETYIRLSYFMNDFPPPRGGISMAKDDQ